MPKAPPRADGSGGMTLNPMLFSAVHSVVRGSNCHTRPFALSRHLLPYALGLIPLSFFGGQSDCIPPLCQKLVEDFQAPPSIHFSEVHTFVLFWVTHPESSDHGGRLSSELSSLPVSTFKWCPQCRLGLGLDTVLLQVLAYALPATWVQCLIKADDTQFLSFLCKCIRIEAKHTS